MYQTTLSPVSNRADWMQGFELVDDETGSVITDLSGFLITVEVRDMDCCRAVLSATTANGKVIDLGGGLIQWTFALDEMRRLGARTYEIGATIERDGFTTQLIIGTLPIVDGIVA